jgi:predicted ABC-type ATPase
VAKTARGAVWVLAGTNGAGKSSILGAEISERNLDFLNPDEAARRIRVADPSLSQTEANSRAWRQNVELLERAIGEKSAYAFETTLGGNTITALLEKAAHQGLDVSVAYVGLRDPELHISRVKARVAHGGHDIPERKIRERYTHSVLNLIRLMPSLAELLVYDNSEEADPYTGQEPRPLLILDFRRGRITSSCEAVLVPEWAKPIMVTAIKIDAHVGGR